VLADAGRASLEPCLAVLAHHLMILSLLALGNNMISLWSLGRGHSNEHGACGGSWGVVRGWLEGLPKIAVTCDRIITLSYGTSWGPYDPTLM
jgi:hypothetical protein